MLRIQVFWVIMVYCTSVRPKEQVGDSSGFYTALTQDSDTQQQSVREVIFGATFSHNINKMNI